MTNPFEFIAAQVNDSVDRHRMAIQDKQNVLHAFFDGLSNEDLALMGSYTVDLAIAPAHEGTYWQGLIEQKLRSRGVCEHCGTDHMAALLDDDHQPVQQGENVVTQDLVEETPEWHQPSFADVEGTPYDDPANREAAENNIRANATTWGVYFVDPSDLQGPVKCGGCDTLSTSLEDRMLRGPGVKGCGTCQQHAKWG